MVRITLYPSSTASVGREFTYAGEAPECASCKVRAICHDLKPGHAYRIVALREKEHECAVHDGGKVKVVEYEELPLEIALPVRKAIEGAIITLEGSECSARWCIWAKLCRASYLPKGSKAKVVALGEELECHIGQKLIRARIQLE